MVDSSSESDLGNISDLEQDIDNEFNDQNAEPEETKESSHLLSN